MRPQLLYTNSRKIPMLFFEPKSYQHYDVRHHAFHSMEKSVANFDGAILNS